MYCNLGQLQDLTSYKSTFVTHLEGIRDKTKVILLLTYEEMLNRLKENQILNPYKRPGRVKVFILTEEE